MMMISYNIIQAQDFTYFAGTRTAGDNKFLNDLSRWWNISITEFLMNISQFVESSKTVRLYKQNTMIFSSSSKSDCKSNYSRVMLVDSRNMQLNDWESFIIMNRTVFVQLFHPSDWTSLVYCIFWESLSHNYNPWKYFF